MLNFSEVKELINIIENSSLRTFELESNEITLKLSKNCETVAPVAAEKVERVVKQPVASEAAAMTVLDEKAVEVKTEAPVAQENLKVVKSPLVGTYYSASAPGEKPYVEVGSKVKKGDILCIVEAMKIMNEITSDFDGEVVEILCDDDDIVEFGLPLFKIK